MQLKASPAVWLAGVVLLLAYQVAFSLGLPYSPHSVTWDMVQNMQSGVNSTKYGSTDYVDMTAKVDYSILDGPGRELTGDRFLGDTVSRETFVTQFVQDVAGAVNISASRVLVMEMAPGWVHHDWEAECVIILFRIIDNVLSGTTGEIGAVYALQNLTEQSHQNSSRLYDGLITGRVDPLWGIVAVSLDVSLRLNMAIDVIGEDLVRDGYYLNQGSSGYCGTWEGSLSESAYCQWENWFRQDVSSATNITLSRVRVLFVKEAALDAVLVHFRLLPPGNYSEDVLVDDALQSLQEQVADYSSPLFQGNVTVWVDPVWGLSGEGGVPRRGEEVGGSHLARHVYPEHQGDEYERCKDTHRCNRAFTGFNSSSRTFNYTTQAFQNGLHFRADLWADFEDWWRAGTHGWEYIMTPGGGAKGDALRKAALKEAGLSMSMMAAVGAGSAAPTGAHFDPWNYSSRGDSTTSRVDGTEVVSGLVLDGQLKDRWLAQLDLSLARLGKKREWAEAVRTVARLGATLRSRTDVSEEMTEELAKIALDLQEMEQLRADINNTQCSAWWEMQEPSCGRSGNNESHYRWWEDVDGSVAEELRSVDNTTTPFNCSYCEVSFNTSSLRLTGATEAEGYLSTTSQGTEVAVWAFEQVVIGPEVRVIVTGQRAMALLSRNSLVLNTTISVEPGELGGFPGGQSVARSSDDRLRLPSDILLEDLVGSNVSLVSNNVNGPGAPTTRFYTMAITTAADDVPEKQRVCTTANPGQTLRGCFHLEYGDALRTGCVSVEASAEDMSRALQDGLNVAPPQDSRSFPLDAENSPPSSAVGVGVGLVNVSSNGTVMDTLGRCWDLTFSSAPRGVAQLQPTWTSDSLVGEGASVKVETLVEGNALGGEWVIDLFDSATPGLPWNVSAEGLEAALQAIPGVDSVAVSRSAPEYQDCSDGLCEAGEMTAGGGLTWTIEITTTRGNISPTSPTAESASEEGAEEWPRLSSYLSGQGSSVTLSKGYAHSAGDIQASFNATSPFSLARGGAGGSYGGSGGQGVEGVSAAGVYNEDYADLLGGSGGGRAGASPHVLAVIGQEMGRGGAGGGAIEFVALGDLILGNQAVVTADGGTGDSDFDGGGGGGSGGMVVLVAGGMLRNEGRISARGADGGPTHRPSSAHGGAGGGGGRVALIGQTVSQPSSSGVDVGGGSCFVTTKAGKRRRGACSEERMGAEGALKVVSLSDTKGGGGARVAIHSSMRNINSSSSSNSSSNSSSVHRAGVHGTNSSLVVERPVLASGAAADKVLYDGVEYTFDEAIQPERVTAFMMAESSSDATAAPSKLDWGGMFALLGSLPTFNSTSNASLGQLSPVDMAIGVSMGSARGIRHTRNFDPRKNGADIMASSVTPRRWYKLDMLLSWDPWTNTSTHGYDHNGTKEVASGKYTILLDGVGVVEDVPFSVTGGGLGRVGLYALPASTVWFDEIYVGPDFTMGFRCPLTTSSGIQLQNHFSKVRWPANVDEALDAQGNAAFDAWTQDDSAADSPFPRPEQHTMQQHENFLTTRNLYNVDIEDRPIKLFEGEGQAKVSADEQYRHSQVREEGLQGAALLYLEPSLTTVSGNTVLWYGEHESEAATSSSDYLSGGVGLCSTNDMVHWTNEGIMLHYSNLTDMVKGREPEGGFVAQQAKVLFSATNETDESDSSSSSSSSNSTAMNSTANSTSESPNFVMWMNVENMNRSMGLAGVAWSEYSDGPFELRRTMYPDGNETHDQTVYVAEDGSAYLARTYTTSVEYVLPAPVMQPVWSSVKDQENDQGDDANAKFGLNYHRAFYSKDYDNFHDVYLQRWRNEDVAWKVVCVNRMTKENRTVEFGETNSLGGYCNEPEEYKVVLGQGQPVVESRFQDPTVSNNSYWRGSSVPAVKSQPWSANYVDGVCGIRHMDEDFDRNDPDLSEWEPVDRSNCSNIADNPMHDTPEDKLIGVQHVVETRWAAYVAISRLTEDLLDTTGELVSFEGKLENGDDLLSLHASSFGWGAASSNGSSSSALLRSTYAPQNFRSRNGMEVDHERRFHQYSAHYNDHAEYSVACVTGSCPGR